MKIFSITGRRKQKSDRELLNDYRIHDDLSALGELFQRYSHLAFFVCEKYLKDVEDSKDAVMEIFEQSIKNLKKFEVTNFKSWLYSTIRNYCNYRLKRIAIEDIFEKNFEQVENYFMENPDFGHLLNEKEVLFKKLENAINRLVDTQKTCIRMFYFERKTYQEIADSTGYSIKQVKSYIQNGKRNLKKLVSTEKKGDENVS